MPSGKAERNGSTGPGKKGSSSLTISENSSGIYRLFLVRVLLSFNKMGQAISLFEETVNEWSSDQAHASPRPSLFTLLSSLRHFLYLGRSAAAPTYGAAGSARRSPVLGLQFGPDSASWSEVTQVYARRFGSHSLAVRSRTRSVFFKKVEGL